MTEEVISNLIWSEYAPLYSYFTPFIQEEMLKSISKLGFGKVLDAGTGVGKAIAYLSKNKKISEISAIDLNEIMLLEAKKNYDKFFPNKKINIFKADINDIENFKEKFDTIYLTNVGYSISNIIPFLRNAYKNLNKGGILIFTNPKRDIDMNIIDEKIRKSDNFSGDNYNRYIEINNILAGESTTPSTYNTQEICDILKLVGFKINSKDINETFYYGYLFSIVARKL